ncbi:AMP-dependent synthetase [Candidatus Marinamargulisbacteria bacterium SCGC AG-410-N11]|nr:AMP-dependent synthetase [Candidatus Marinamargulisbacteria bacterium SCGC AG-410-N11]
MENCTLVNTDFLNTLPELSDDQKIYLNSFFATINKETSYDNRKAAWKRFVDDYNNSNYSLDSSSLCSLFFDYIYSGQHTDLKPAISWFTNQDILKTSNLGLAMKRQSLQSYSAFHTWSYENIQSFWNDSLTSLNIKFKNSPSTIFKESNKPFSPQWLPNASMNIIDSCFNAPDSRTAIIQNDPDGNLLSFSYLQLKTLTNQVANTLNLSGLKKGSSISYIGPMTFEGTAIYLGIIAAGMVAVPIPDSFSSEAIKRRSDIANCKLLFITHAYPRQSKVIELYDKAIQQELPPIVAINSMNRDIKLPRPQDIFWNNWLSNDATPYSYASDPNDTMTILFSSGTTGDPKAIPWTHTTPIKAAIDGYYHQDIKPEDRVCWPTNLGWMMGPWLIFASLINRSTMVLFEGSPLNIDFSNFITQSKVTILGTVPAMVSHWLKSDWFKTCDWTSIRLFSSTGERSNSRHYFKLMAKLKFKAPIIEYCGGTEIGGGYITNSIVQDLASSTFSTPAVGLNFYLYDDRQSIISSGEGEVFIQAPSIGLSQTLLNKDHDKIYYLNTPLSSHGIPLRRHQDQFRILEGGYFQATGRVDDSMNLNGIKVGTGDIEQVINAISYIQESAAIAVPSEGNGPDLLVIYVVCLDDSLSDHMLKRQLQRAINVDLNPLFKIFDVKQLPSLPKTASNKIMRRDLRTVYQRESSTN